MRGTWHRLDSTRPEDWTWTPYPTPRSRFDSARGRRRVRYAGQAPRVAMRERFDHQRRRVRATDLELFLIELRGSVRVLDLRRDHILDALGLDDQVSTSRARDVWAACQLLVDLVQEWFGERCDGLVYRSRTTPERSANLAFFAHAPLAPARCTVLREEAALLDSCILNDGFEVMGWR
jgi:hypothetical protein